jgi:hypothetical protein
MNVMTSQYERQTARRARRSPEGKAIDEAKRKIRYQLSRVYKVFKYDRYLSDTDCIRIVGLPVKEFKSYIEKQCKPEWTWKNYGSTNYGGVWNLDHIIALAHHNVLDPVEAKAVNHWTNLRPMCARENDKRQHR